MRARLRLCAERSKVKVVVYSHPPAWARRVKQDNNDNLPVTGGVVASTMQRTLGI